MHHRELAERLGKLMAEDRRLTLEFLTLLKIALVKESYLKLAYPTLFEWLTKGFGFSNASAFRRIEVAKLLLDLPELHAQLQAGTFNLTGLAKAQTIVHAEEKERKAKISLQEKRKALKEMEGKNAEEAVNILLKHFPLAASKVKNERRKVIDKDTIRLSMNLNAEITADLQRAKEVLSHIVPSGREAEVFGYCLKFTLKKKDPLRYGT